MIGSLINKYFDASNRINPTKCIVRKRLCNYYRISLCIVSYSTLICVMKSLKIRKGRKGQTTIYKSYTSDTICVSVQLHVCAVMGSIKRDNYVNTYMKRISLKKPLTLPYQNRWNIYWPPFI
jgi:hypothetical protein